MGQHTFRCYITQAEVANILESAKTLFNFTLMGRISNSMERLDAGFLMELQSFEYSDFALGFVGSCLKGPESWLRGDVQFANISNVYGYLNVLELCVRTEPGAVGHGPKPVNADSGCLFAHLSKDISKISRFYDDLCVVSTGAKLHRRARMTTGSREALLNGTMLTGGNLPKCEPVVVIGLCSPPSIRQVTS